MSINSLNEGLDYNLPFPLEFIIQNKDEILVDTCFFLFNVCCKTFVVSKKIDYVKKIFEKYYTCFIPIDQTRAVNQKLFEICTQEIVQDKVAFFLGLYGENIFLKLDYKNNTASVILVPGYEEALMFSIRFLFKLMLNYNENQGSSFQACFSLKSLLGIDILKPYYNRIFEGFFDNLISGVKEIELYPYFDLIIDIISIPPCKLKTNFVFDANINSMISNNNCSDFSELSNRKMPFTHDQMIELIKSCVERCLKELKSTKGSSNGLSKCFNILLTISEIYLHNELHPKVNLLGQTNEQLPGNSYDKLIQVTTMEFLISPITSYIKNPSKIDCELEIIDLITNLQKHIPTILESTVLIIKYIEKIIQKNETINKSIYEIIYQFFDKGSEYLRSIHHNLNNQGMGNSTEEAHIVSNKENNIIEALIDVINQNLNDYDCENTFILGVFILQKIIQVSYFKIFIILYSIDLQLP